MSNTRGFQFTRGSDAPRNLEIKSTFPVAIVLLVSTSPGLHYFDSPKDALAYFSENVTTSGGNWERYLDLWENKFEVTVPIVVSCVEPSDDADALKANVIDGINLLKKSKLKFDLLTVPDFGTDKNIVGAMVDVCEAKRARTYVDIDSENLVAAQTARGLYASSRLTLVKSAMGTFNTDTETNEWYDGGTVAVFFRALLDGSAVNGWYKSLSNKKLPMDSVKHETDYHAGMDETDPLNEVQVVPVIEDNGLRFWFSDHTCADDIWERNGLVVRLVDNMAETMRRDLQSQIDEDYPALDIIEDSADEFKNRLIKDKLLLGGEIEFLTEEMTDAMISAGDFKFKFDFQESPKVRRVSFHYNKVNSYSSVIVKMMKG
jgi:phage tail sheath protein FI